MEGTVKPDYAQVVGISTRSAQKELVPLATISVVMPLLVGLVLQVEALGGFLAGVILSGPAVGSIHVECWWCLGQCQESNRR